MQEAHLFDSFYEIRDGQSGGAGSSGLGLAIAKSIVDLHGGKIWATSNVGEGSHFHFSLPIGEPEESLVDNKDETTDSSS